MIAVLVVVHEGGHYLAGRLFGAKIEAFGVGFGRELLGWTDRRGVRWKINAIPLGGYAGWAYLKRTMTAQTTSDSTQSRVPASGEAGTARSHTMVKDSSNSLRRTALRADRASFSSSRKPSISASCAGLRMSRL